MILIVGISLGTSHNQHTIQLKPTKFRYVNAHHTSTVRRMSAGSVLSGLSLNYVTTSNKSLGTLTNSTHKCAGNNKLTMVRTSARSRSPSISSSSVTPSSLIVKQASYSSKRSNAAASNNCPGGQTTIAVGTRFRFKSIRQPDNGSDMRRAEFYSNYYDWRESRDDVVINGEANRQIEENFYDDDDYFNTINKNVMKKRFAINAGARSNKANIISN